MIGFLILNLVDHRLDGFLHTRDGDFFENSSHAGTRRHKVRVTNDGFAIAMRFDPEITCGVLGLQCSHEIPRHQVATILGCLQVVAGRVGLVRQDRHIDLVVDLHHTRGDFFRDFGMQEIGHEGLRVVVIEKHRGDLFRRGSGELVDSQARPGFSLDLFLQGDLMARQHFRTVGGIEFIKQPGKALCGCCANHRHEEKKQTKS